MKRFVISLALWVGLASCGQVALVQGTVTEATSEAVKATNQPSNNQTTAGNLTAVRLAHVSPDAPTLDLLVDGRLRLQDVNFTEVSSYVILPAGEHELRVFPHRSPSETGSGDSATATVLAPEPFIISVNLEPGRYYTLATPGFFEPPPNQDQLGVLSLSMPAETTATVTGPRAYATAVTGSSELSELFPGTYAITASQEGFKTAQYEAEVQPNKTAFLSIALQANSEGETSNAQTLPANETVHSNEASSGLEWRNVQLQLYEDKLGTFPPPGFALVRVIHTSPITSAVSVVLARGGQNETGTSESLVNNLSYPNETDYLAVAAGQMSFRLLASDTSQVITDLANLELNAGTIYTFFIIGTRTDNFVSVIPTIDAVLAGNP
jgi:Domain of unknown function (DUF4397)